jgi:hypothetical protein
VRNRQRPDRENPDRERGHLKQENRILKRQVAKLRREVERLEGLREESPGDQPPEQSQRPGATPSACPLCGKPALKKFQLPFSDKVVVGCTSCKKYKSSAGGLL